jgi:hypothetical protein
MLGKVTSTKKPTCQITRIVPPTIGRNRSVILKVYQGIGAKIPDVLLLDPGHPGVTVYPPIEHI